MQGGKSGTIDGPDGTDGIGDERRPMQKLGQYEWPSMPAEETVRRFYARALAMVRKDDDAPFITKDKLRRITRDRLDAVAAPPACGPVLAELGIMVDDWLAGDGKVGVKTIVTPPCDRNSVVAGFARQRGYAILDAPDREKLSSPVIGSLPDLAGDGVLVIPNLENWFLRHANGLVLVRALLAAIEANDRPCLIGCNSWAWSFLRKAVEVDMLLPDAQTFAPFDAARLQAWFSQLTQADGTRAIDFRFVKNGDAVFGKNGDDAAPSDYFRRLAAHSLGIPWVAWHLWRDSLFSDLPLDENGEHAEDIAAAGGKDEDGQSGDIDAATETLWVAALDETITPGGLSQATLLVLQALLIHGELSANAMAKVTPIVGQSNVLPALITAGFVERDGNLMHLNATAYPVIRDALKNAGFSMDTL